MKKALILALALVLALSLVSCGTTSNTPAANSTAASVTAESETTTDAAADTANQDDIDPFSISAEEFIKALPNISTEKLTKLLPELEESRVVLREKASKEQTDDNINAYYAARDKKTAAEEELATRK